MANFTAATVVSEAKIILNVDGTPAGTGVAVASIVVGLVLVCVGLLNTLELRLHRQKNDDDLVFQDFNEDDAIQNIGDSPEQDPGLDNCRDEWSLVATFVAYFGLDCLFIGVGMFSVTYTKATITAFLVLSVLCKTVMIYLTLRTFERKRLAPKAPWQQPRVKNLWLNDIVTFAPLKDQPAVSGLFVKRLGNANPLNGQPNLIDNVNALYDSDITGSQASAPVPANSRGKVTYVQNEGVRPYALVSMEAAPNDLLKIYKVNFHHLEREDSAGQTCWNPKSIYANPAFGLFFTTFIFVIQAMLFFHVYLALQEKVSCKLAKPLKLWCESQGDVTIQKTRFFFAAWIVQCVSTLGGGAASSAAAQKNIASLFRSREGALSYATWKGATQWSMVADGVPSETTFRRVYCCELYLRAFMLFVANIIKTFILLATHIYLVQEADEMEFVKDSFALIFVAQLDAIGTYCGANEDIVFRCSPIKTSQRQRRGNDGYTQMAVAGGDGSGVSRRSN